jgi:hypothetical protein
LKSGETNGAAGKSPCEDQDWQEPKTHDNNFDVHPGGAKNQDAVSEKSITQQQAGLVRRAKNEPSEPLTWLGPALVANSLCRGQEKHTMHKPEVQIGNSG